MGSDIIDRHPLEAVAAAFETPAAVRVKTVDDIAAAASSRVDGAVILWEHPVAMAEALKRLPVLDGRFAIGASITIDDARPEDMAAAQKAGIRLITWAPSPDIDSSSESTCLLEASRQGLWNHVRFSSEPSHHADLAAFAANNPNIVHSWQVGDSTGTFTAPPREHPLAAGYGDVAPLDGVPLWRNLGSPGALLLALHSQGRDRVLRRRIAPDTGRQWDIGTDMEWHFVPPEALPGDAMDELCLMVAAGGSVNTRWVRHNLERAFLIAYVTERGRIVGNSSLKHPREEYIHSVKARYGLDLSNHLERGYTSVRPEYRGMGIGTRLLAGLTQRADGRKLFSIIAEDNIATQKIAIRNCTRKVATVFSEAMGKEIGFWVPEE